MDKVVGNLCEELIATVDQYVAEPNTDVSKQFNHMALLMVQLKKMNRTVMNGLASKQAEVDNAKSIVDKAQLRLENLLYKQSYLLREIRMCKDFSTPQLEMVEKEIGQMIGARTYSADLSEVHKKSLAMLKSELLARKLDQEILTNKKSLSQTNTEKLNLKRKFMDDLPNKIDAIKVVSNELNDFISNNSTVNCNITNYQISDVNYELSKSLPEPLYILYRSLLNFTNVDLCSDVASDTNNLLIPSSFPTPFAVEEPHNDYTSNKTTNYERNSILTVNIGESKISSSSQQQPRREDANHINPNLFVELVLARKNIPTSTAASSSNITSTASASTSSTSLLESTVTIRFYYYHQNVSSSSASGNTLSPTVVASVHSMTGVCKPILSHIPLNAFLSDILPNDTGVELPVYTSLIPQNAMEFQWCNYICGIRRLPEYRSSHHVDSMEVDHNSYTSTIGSVENIYHDPESIHKNGISVSLLLQKLFAKLQSIARLSSILTQLESYGISSTTSSSSSKLVSGLVASASASMVVLPPVVQSYLNSYINTSSASYDNNGSMVTLKSISPIANSNSIGNAGNGVDLFELNGVASMTDSDNPFFRQSNERLFTVCYRLSIQLPAFANNEIAHVIMELKPFSYPLMPPQFKLAPPRGTTSTNSASSSSGALSATVTSRTGHFTSSYQAIEIQLLLHSLSMTHTQSIYSSNGNTNQNQTVDLTNHWNKSVISKRGRNRKSALISTLYGRVFRK